MEDPAQLETAISNLISDLASPVSVSDDRLSPSPLPDTQLVKAAIISQRLPPAAVQASQAGIKTIHHSVPTVGKDKYLAMKRESDKESNASSPAPTNCQNSVDFDESRHFLSPKRPEKQIPTNSRRSDKIISELPDTSAVRKIVSPAELPRTVSLTLFFK